MKAADEPVVKSVMAPMRVWGNCILEVGYALGRCISKGRWCQDVGFICVGIPAKREFVYLSAFPITFVFLDWSWESRAS